MSDPRPQGHRSGEGTSDLWNHIRDDDLRKDQEPDRRSNEEARQQYSRPRQQQPAQGRA